MNKIITLALAAIFLLQACKKKDNPEKPADCATVLCITMAHLLNIRLMDADGKKNLLYGPDASIPKENISLYYADKPVAWISSPDSATSTGYLSVHLQPVYAAGSLQTPGDDFALDFTLKVKLATGEKTFLLHVLNHRNCCGAIVQGIQINKTGILYKSGDNNGYQPVNLPLVL